MSSLRFAVLGLVVCGVMGSVEVRADLPASNKSTKADADISGLVASPADRGIAASFRSLQNSISCSEYKANFKAFYKAIRLDGLDSAGRRDRVRMAIALSCSEKFRSCNEEFCRSNGSNSDIAATVKSAPAAAAVQSRTQAAPAPIAAEVKLSEVKPLAVKAAEKRPLEVIPVPAALEKAAEITVRPELAETSPAPTFGRGIETDKMAWLSAPMSCEQFAEQVSSRYQPFGNFQTLPAQIKEEARIVVKTACSDRYRDCHFAQCDKIEALEGPLAPLKKTVEKKTVKMIGNKIVESQVELSADRPARALLDPNWGVEQANTAVVPAAGRYSGLSTEELKAEAERMLNSKIASHRAVLKKQIKAEVERDLKEHRTWQAIAMYEEMAPSIERRKERAGREKDQEKPLKATERSGGNEIITVRGTDRPVVRSRSDSDTGKVKTSKRERRWGEPRASEEDSGGDQAQRPGPVEEPWNTPDLNQGGGPENGGIGDSGMPVIAPPDWSSRSGYDPGKTRASLGSDLVNGSGVSWGGGLGNGRSQVKEHANSGDRGGPVPVPNLY